MNSKTFYLICCMNLQMGLPWEQMDTVPQQGSEVDLNAAMRLPKQCS